MSDIPASDTDEQLLWIRRRAPVALRFLLVPLGLFFVVYPSAAAISAGRRLTSSPVEWIGAIVIICFGIMFGIMFLEVALCRGDIRFDPVTRDLILHSTGGIFGRWRTRVPTTDVTAIEFYVPQHFFGGSPQLRLRLRDGRSEILCWLSQDDADGSLHAISKALGIRSIRHDTASA